MNTITLTIAATPDNLKRLADAFGECIDETLPADSIPAHRRPADAQTKGAMKSAEISLTSRTPETEAKPPETVAKTPETEADSKITLSDLRAKGTELTKGEHREAIKELLAEFGVARISEVAESDYAEFYKRMEAIG